MQDLLLGDSCCIDIMGATEFRSNRGQWNKMCCSNPRGPFVQPPKDLANSEMGKLDKQIGKMGALKEVSKWRVDNFV